MRSISHQPGGVAPGGAEPPGTRGPREAWALLAVAAAVMLARIPAIWCGRELNVDESQMMAQALRFTIDPVPWRGVDGTSSGPVNSWFLLVAHRLGMPLTYQAVHALAAACWVAAIGALHVFCTRRVGARGAWLGTLAAALWVGTQLRPDFVHFSSEVVPVLLIAVALAGASGGAVARVGGAVLLGAVPWAKLQATPIAGLAGLWLVGLALRGGAMASGRRAWGEAGLLVAASLIPSVVILGMVAWGGALEDFWRSYVLANLHYSGPLGFAEWIKRVARRLYAMEAIMPWTIAGVVAVGAMGLADGWRGARRWRVPGLLGLGLWLGAVVAVTRPFTMWDHYCALLIPGLVVLTATVAAWVAARVSGRAFFWVAAGGLATALVLRIPAVLEARRYLWAAGTWGNDAAQVSRAIERVAPGARNVAVWGWMPGLYVERQQPPPVRHAIGHFLMVESPVRDFLRASFMRDFVAARPDVVIDSTERSYERQWADARAAHFPELQAVLARDYACVHTEETGPGPVRIYVRQAP